MPLALAGLLLAALPKRRANARAGIRLAPPGVSPDVYETRIRKAGIAPHGVHRHDIGDQRVARRGEVRKTPTPSGHRGGSDQAEHGGRCYSPDRASPDRAVPATLGAAHDRCEAILHHHTRYPSSRMAPLRRMSPLPATTPSLSSEAPTPVFRTNLYRPRSPFQHRYGSSRTSPIPGWSEAPNPVFRT